MTKIKLIVILLGLFILIGMLIAAQQGNSLIKKYDEFQNTTDSELNLPEIFSSNEVLIYLEFFCFLSTLFGEFFSHCKFERKLCRKCVAISFILSSVWMNFAYLFLYGSKDFNESMIENVKTIERVKQDGKLQETFDDYYISFITTWHQTYQLRTILFIVIIPAQLVYIYTFMKFISTKKEEIEQKKLFEMRKIYEELEQSQL